MKKRIFIGIAIPEEICHGLNTELQNIPGRKVPWQNWHLTLQFLLLNNDELDHLKATIAKQNFKEAFLLSLKNLGAFPKETNAKLLWIGVNQGQKELELLALKLSQALEKEGYKIDTRPYIPHLTIRRFFPAQDVRNIINEVDFNEYEFLVTELILYESILEEKGSHYIHLASYALH